MKKDINYLLMLIFIVALSGAAQGNLLPNGDFSAGAEYWNIDLIGTGYIDFDDNLAFIDTGPDGAVSLESDKFGIPTATLDYSFDYAVDRWAGEDLPLLQIRFYDGSEQFVDQENTELSDTSWSWVSQSGQVTPPEDAVYADVRITAAFYEDRDDFDGIVEIDNIVIEADLWIATQPEGVVADEGDDVSFTVEAGTPEGVTASYQWYKSADPTIDIVNDEPLGAEQTLELLDVSSDDVAYYYCEISAGQAVLYSRVVALTFGDLVAHWSLDADDFSDGQYIDLSDEGNHAVVDGTPIFVDGIVTGDRDPENMKANGAVEIAEETGSANVGSWDPAAYTDQFSISVWFKWYESGGDTDFNTIIAKRDAFEFNQMLYAVNVYTPDQQVIMEVPGGGWMGTAEGLVEPAQWHHLVVTYDGAAAQIYLDGELEAADDNFIMGTKDDATFWIGRNEYAPDWFEGVLDDLRVYNYALEATDIYDLNYAETGQQWCLPELQPQWDLTGDCEVGFMDFALLAGEWLKDALYHPQSP